MTPVHAKATTATAGGDHAVHHNATLRRARIIAVCALTFFFAAPSARAAEPALLDSEQIFERYADRVLQIRIVEAGSGAQSVIGTGFVVGRAGEVATNYHVIAGLVHEPERYRAEWVDAKGASHAATLLGFDVVRDLALMRVAQQFEEPFRLHAGALRNGRRIFAVGNPFDIGMSIVEGAYNGRLQHSRYERIHFTGSLNPGMSGGPALLEDGSVMGVNVASAGNQVSFLVPARALRALLERVRAPGYAPPADAMRELRNQLWRHQEAYFGEILAATPTRVKLGALEAPSQLMPFFRCAGDLHKKETYRARVHHCRTDDRIYISDAYELDVIRLRHWQLESDTLSPVRFYRLYSHFFENNWSKLDGDDDDFGEFHCDTAFVNTEALHWKAVFCARRYLELEGLYDVVFKAARLGAEPEGFETALVMTAVGFENARALARRHLEAIRWSE